jgi:hypothetical protein
MIQQKLGLSRFSLRASLVELTLLLVEMLALFVELLLVLRNTQVSILLDSL